MDNVARVFYDEDDFPDMPGNVCRTELKEEKFHTCELISVDGVLYRINMSTGRFTSET